MTVIQDSVPAMEEDRASSRSPAAAHCWTGQRDRGGGVRIARRNGESPMDRGAALRRRVEALADGHGLARGFERPDSRARLPPRRERGGVARPRRRDGAPVYVAHAKPWLLPRSLRETVGRHLPRREPGALYLFGGAFEAVFGWDAGRIGAAPGSVLYVTASARRRIDAIPITRCFGKPERRKATWHIASSGFETMIGIASGERLTTSSTTAETIPALVFNKSSRLIPGLRGQAGGNDHNIGIFRAFVIIQSL